MEFKVIVGSVGGRHVLAPCGQTEDVASPRGIVYRTVADIRSAEHKVVDGKRNAYDHVDVRVLYFERFGRD